MDFNNKKEQRFQLYKNRLLSRQVIDGLYFILKELEILRSYPPSIIYNFEFENGFRKPDLEVYKLPDSRLAREKEFMAELKKLWNR